VLAADYLIGFLFSVKGGGKRKSRE
jgi:hypothetical protein